MLNQSVLPSVAAIGNFDGVHLGHQKILQKTLEIARLKQLQPVLLTFEPSPREYFHPQQKIPRLTNLREKVNFIRQHFFEKIIVLKFNLYFSQLYPDEFIKNILIKKLNIQHVVIGQDFKFGFHKIGNSQNLSQYFPSEIIPPVFDDNKRISSTWLREILQQSDFNLAQKLLGRQYSLTGKVIKGQQRGRLLGFPTANIALGRRVPPMMGVFAVKVNQSYNAIANVGIRPTVNLETHQQKIFLEVHLFDCEKDLYGQWLEVEFLCKIRDEKRFESLNDLKNQISQDIIIAKKFLSMN